MPDRWLTDALATRDIERVIPNMAAAGERINDARRHVRSALLLADNDSTLAMSACHDAIRKAITAHMAASGLRPRAGDGAHRLVLDYARHEIAGLVRSRRSRRGGRHPQGPGSCRVRRLRLETVHPGAHHSRHRRGRADRERRRVRARVPAQAGETEVNVDVWGSETTPLTPENVNKRSAISVMPGADGRSPYSTLLRSASRRRRASPASSRSLIVGTSRSIDRNDFASRRATLTGVSAITSALRGAGSRSANSPK